MFVAKGLSAVYMMHAELLLDERPVHGRWKQEAPMQDGTLEVMSKINQGIQIVISASRWDCMEPNDNIIRETAEMIVDNEQLFDVEQDISHANHWFVYSQSNNLKTKLLSQLVKILPFKKAIIFCNARYPIQKICQELQQGAENFVDLTCGGRPYGRPSLQKIKAARVLVALNEREGENMEGLAKERCRVIINFDVPLRANHYMERTLVGAADEPLHIISLITDQDEGVMEVVEDEQNIRFEELPGDASDTLKFE